MSNEEGSDKPLHTYRGEKIDVVYDATLCTKVGECKRGLPEVFRSGVRPWVDAGGASPDQIAEVIRRCPTGALKYVRHDGGPQEEPEPGTTVSVQKGGPYNVRGDITITDHRGNVLRKETRVALCRCGQSKNKPFCDGAHNSIFLT